MRPAIIVWYRPPEELTRLDVPGESERSDTNGDEGQSIRPRETSQPVFLSLLSGRQPKPPGGILPVRVKARH